jgi:predicted aminopeptidase
MKTQQIWIFLGKPLILLLTCLLLSSCETGYLIKNSYYQLRLLQKREPIESILQQEKLNAEEKRKLQLAQEAKQFAEEKMGLATTKNYTSYVALDEKYLTYVVSASEKWNLQAIQWSFPITGAVPYKGFFQENQAVEFEKELLLNNVDTYRRGVSAYSTLGWFNDPIYSSMLNYNDEDLVNTIIHETVHATIYIPSSADFNERLASFLGNQGTLEFYRQKEGPHSLTVLKIIENNHDEAVFAKFISEELVKLEAWYPTISVQDDAKHSFFEFL